MVNNKCFKERIFRSFMSEQHSNKTSQHQQPSSHHNKTKVESSTKIDIGPTTTTAAISQQQKEEQEATKVGAGSKISKLTLQTQFIKVEITDPNILDELNTVEKYPSNLGYTSAEININKHGGRIAVCIEDKKEVLREILSGVSNKEMQNIKSWTVERS